MSSELLLPEVKRVKIDPKDTNTTWLIGTHNGTFHADEALSVYMLRLLPEFYNSKIVRTRNADILEKCNIVVDVGGEYNEINHRYDHHQRGFDVCFPGKSTKLSSAGLVYMHFGRQIISHLIPQVCDNEESINLIYEKVYADFIEAFDANDNGISVYDVVLMENAAIKRRFNSDCYTIAACVQRLNYSDNVKCSNSLKNIYVSGMDKDLSDSEVQENAKFTEASEFCGRQFVLAVMDTFRCWLPSRQIVREAFINRKLYDPSGKILILPYSKSGISWTDHLYTIEKEYGLNETDQVLYVLFPENDHENSPWRIRAVSVQDSTGFQNRKDLRHEWKGLRDEKLQQISGVKDAVFVHASGFIGGAGSKEGVLKLARQSLQD